MALSSGTGSGSGDIANRWRELHGEHSWQGLLDPLDMDLRKSILSYGELEEATGGFNKETHSPHYGLCMYGYDDLLTKSGAGAAAARNYKVTKFLYATEANKLTWIGYVAAATDEGVAALGRRDVVVVWRGTMTGTELQEDMQFVPAFPWTELGLLESFHHPLALVHGGFLSLYTASGGGVVDDSTSSIKGSARDQALEEVKRLMHLYKDEEASITVVGHSLGSALAILNAVDLVGNRVNIQRLFKSCPVTAIVFACPHVGNQAFKDAFDSFKDLRALHIRNRIDHVPRLMKWLPDLGVTLQIDTSLSPYLKDPEKTAHNLQCYLHAVAGEVGKFKLVVDLDIALVNKDADALKHEYHVPASWWVAENKGMVKNDQGKWELRDFEHY